MKEVKKNILIIVHHLQIGGGAEKIASQLGTSLHSLNYDITFLTFYDFNPKYEYKGKFICLNETLKQDPFSKAYKVILRARKISKICKEKKIDTVISFLHDSNFSSILSKMLFFNKSKIIVSERNNTLAQSFLFQKLVKWLYPKADLVVTLSKGVEVILNKYFNVKKTKTIYNMQAVTKFKSLGKENITVDKHLTLFNKDFIFISIGRLSTQKSQKNLIKSFRLVVDSNPKCKLLIFGGGELKKELQQLIKSLKLEEHVFLMGVVENVHSYLKKSNCFVFSSQWEGFGNVLTEAMTHNIPVISTDCKSGPREILCPELGVTQKISYPYYGEFGTLVQTFNDSTPIKDVAQREYLQGEKILAQEMLKEMSSSSKEDTFKRAQNFDKSIIIKQWERII